jgi:hypothetical protein
MEERWFSCRSELGDDVMMGLCVSFLNLIEVCHCMYPFYAAYTSQTS